MVKQLRAKVRDTFPRVSPVLTAVAAWMAVLAAAIHGADYVLLPQSAELTVVEAAAPLPVWGWLLVVAAAFAAAGWTSRCYPVAVIGHAGLAALYTAFGWGLVWAGWLDVGGRGWRDGFGYLLVEATVHTVVVIAAWKAWDQVRK